MDFTVESFVHCVAREFQRKRMVMLLRLRNLRNWNNDNLQRLMYFDNNAQTKQYFSSSSLLLPPLVLEVLHMIQRSVYREFLCFLYLFELFSLKHIGTDLNETHKSCNRAC